MIARQSTALELAIGPVLDADGVAVTDCVVADFKLKKTTGNFAALNGSATLTHVSAGMYDLVLTTSDTDTVGLATIAIDDTVNACAPVRLQVIEEAIYDALYAASANAFQGAAGSTKVTGVVLTDTATTLTNLPSITAGWLTAAGIAADAFTAAKFAADVTTELQSGLATAAAIATVDTVVDAIKAVTDLLPDAGALTSLATQASVNTIDDLLDTEIAALTTELAKVPKSDGTASWNATALAAIQSECNDALVAYDPPTKAELDAADDAVLAAIAALNDIAATDIVSGGAITTSGGAVSTVTNLTTKTGFKLASDGLDSIAVTAPSTVATTFPGMVVQLFRRFFAKSTLTSTELKTYADNGSTVVTTQTVSDDGTTQTQGAAS